MHKERGGLHERPRPPLPSPFCVRGPARAPPPPARAGEGRRLRRSRAQRPLQLVPAPPRSDGRRRSRVPRTMVELNSGYPRSLPGALKIARLVVAFVTCICFAASKSHEAFIALAIMEFVITLLFFLLYLLKLDKKMKFLFWPLADIFNSLIAVLFFIIVCLCAIIIKTTTGTLVGGVFGLLLVGLCIADSVLLFKKITFNKPRGRNVITR
ncbi:chemokine-like factor [Caretta caretta]|uniref:chemokine-like factor n=1 Tax=Caretta caretta TaxID=8467 RepID=UPI003D5B85F9